MGYQFIHVESYGRKGTGTKGGRTVDFILEEAARAPAACQHLGAPQPPTVLFGCTIPELRTEHDRLVGEARATIKGGKARKIRVDQHTLLTVVASHPARLEEIANDHSLAAEVEAWERATVAWLREQYGGRLRCVVRHADEPHAHLHAYVLPDDPEMKAKSLHPGAAAKTHVVEESRAAGAEAKAANAAGDRAYCEAMRAWQDSYWQAVGVPCGLTRRGPGRRRLTREQWKLEQAQAGSVASLESRAAGAKERVERAARAVAKAREASAAARQRAQQADTKLEEAERVRIEAEVQAEHTRRTAASWASRTRRDARSLLVRAQHQAACLASWGGRLGIVWAAIIGTRRRLEAAAAERVAEAEERLEATSVRASERVAAAEERERTLRKDLSELHRRLQLHTAAADQARQERDRARTAYARSAERVAALERALGLALTEAAPSPKPKRG